MTTNPLAALTTGLEGASDAKLLEVVAILDRLADRGPADQLLQPVRARLARLRPPRPLTLRRVLVLPFEDLLVQAGDYQPERRRLSRATLRPLLDIALSGLEPGLARTLEAAARGRDMREGDVVLSVGERLWPAAHRALVARLAANTPAPEAAAQLAAVAELLPLAHAIVTTLWELPPRPMGPLSPEAVGIAARLVEAAHRRGPDPAWWVLELLLARSRSPDVILAPLRSSGLGLPRQERDAVVARIVRGRVAELRAAAERLEGGGDEPARADDLVELVSELDALDERWCGGQLDRAALRQVRQAAGRMVERHLDRELGGAMPAAVRELAAAGGLEDAAVEEVEAAARSARRLALAGSRLGLAPSAEELLDPYLDGVRAALVGGPVLRAGTRTTPGLMDQLRVVEILFGPELAVQCYREAIGASGAP